jgi:hypothetical protein
VPLRKLEKKNPERSDYSAQKTKRQTTLYQNSLNTIVRASKAVNSAIVKRLKNRTFRVTMRVKSFVYYICMSCICILKTVYTPVIKGGDPSDELYIWSQQILLWQLNGAPSLGEHLFWYDSSPYPNHNTNGVLLLLRKKTQNVQTTVHKRQSDKPLYIRIA